MFRWLEHTGEAELAIEAPTAEAVFVDALLALRELIGAGEHGGRVTRRVTASGVDRPTLLADWLSELVFLAETEGFVADRVVALHLGEGNLAATVSGHLASPPHLVKAVTYHRLTLEQAGSEWKATVVLDV